MALTTIEMTMLIGYAVAALVATGNLRAQAWLGAGALTFIATSAYWRIGLPHPELVSGLTDALVCLGIYFLGAYRWEMWVWRLFQTMVLVNALYLAGTLGIFHDVSHDTYAVTLEALNWLAILMIGGAASLQRVGYDNGWLSAPGRGFRGVVRTICAKRVTPPFTAARR